MNSRIIVLLLTLFLNDVSSHRVTIKHIFASSNHWYDNQKHVSWFNLTRKINENPSYDPSRIECASSKYEKSPWIIIDTGHESHFIETMILYQNLVTPLHDFKIQVTNNSCDDSSKSSCYIQFNPQRVFSIEVECKQYGRFVMLRVFKYKQAIVSLCHIDIFTPPPAVHLQNCSQWSESTVIGECRNHGDDLTRNRTRPCTCCAAIECIDHNWDNICERISDIVDKEFKCKLHLYKTQCSKTCQQCLNGNKNQTSSSVEETRNKLKFIQRHVTKERME